MSMRVGWFAGLAAGAILLAGVAHADTFVVNNTTHPELYHPAPGAVGPAQVDGNGSASPIAGGFQIVGPDGLPQYSPDNTTSVTAIALAPETLTYFWQYISFDAENSSFDPAGFVLNGVNTQLTTAMPSLQIVGGQLVRPVQSGVVTFNLKAGDSYGFYVRSTDSDQGPGTLSFSTNAPAVPEPAAWTMLILGFGMVGAGLRRLRARPTAVQSL
jgi:hypothetical protein